MSFRGWVSYGLKVKSGFENLRLLACERKFQDFYLSQTNFILSQIHSVFSWFCPNLILLIIRGYVFFLFWLFIFNLFYSLKKNPKTLKLDHL